MEKTQIQQDYENNNVGEEFSYSSLMEHFYEIRTSQENEVRKENALLQDKLLNTKEFNKIVKKIPKEVKKRNPIPMPKRVEFSIVRDSPYEREVEFVDGVRKTFKKKHSVNRFSLESYILKELEKGKDLNEIPFPYGEGMVNEYLSPFQLVNIMRILSAKEFVKKYNKENGFLVNERIRDGFIGQEKFINGQKVLQTCRGFPLGTLVAIPYGKDILVGVSMVDNEDKFKQRPVLGLAMALRDALNKKGDPLPQVEKLGEYPQLSGMKIPNKYIHQLKHFIRRARAFYFPELYSFSRGKIRPTDEEYSVWKKNRANRDAVLSRFDIYKKM